MSVHNVRDVVAVIVTTSIDHQRRRLTSALGHQHYAIVVGLRTANAVWGTKFTHYDLGVVSRLTETVRNEMK